MASEIENALYTVATPIGNLDDITLRAKEVLSGVDFIACEDTRRTSVLCEKFNINSRLISYHKFSEKERLELFLGYLREGKSVAVVSDAGTPLISDPGEVLVEAVQKEGFRVIPIVGACAVLALLQSVERCGESFKFVGFLPRVKAQIEEIFIENRFENLVFYESPNRVISTLSALLNARGEVKISFGRELTKKFEEIKTLNLSSALEKFNSNAPKGEFVFLIHADKKTVDDETEMAKKASILKELKLSDKDITNVLVALFDFPKNKIKEILFKL